MHPKQTETLDKLYLEWSQFTQAKTSRERSLEAEKQLIADQNTDHCSEIKRLDDIIDELKRTFLSERETFDVGNLVSVYDRYRFTGKLQQAVVVRIEGIENGVEVRFIAPTGSPSKYPVGSTVMVCKEQLRHRTL